MVCGLLACFMQVSRSPHIGSLSTHPSIKSIYISVFPPVIANSLKIHFHSLVPVFPEDRTNLERDYLQFLPLKKGGKPFAKL